MRVTVFDANPGRGLGQAFLKTSWLVGCWLQKLLGLVDDYYGASSWDDALAWLVGRPEPISAVQYWGHGSPGTVWLAGKTMPITALSTLKPKLKDHTASVWFRCCNVFQGTRGHAFAKQALAALNCRVVAHTYIVGLWQSGGHSVMPLNPVPNWSLEEGTKLKNPWWPDYLRPWLPNTVFCMTTKIPPNW